MPICSKCKEDKATSEFSPKSRKDPSQLRAQCKACVTAYTREWQRANRDRTKRYKAKWETANKEKHLEGKRRRYHANGDAERAKMRARRTVDPEAYREYQRRRKEKIRSEVGYAFYRYGLTLTQRAEIVAAQGNACAICRRDFGTRRQTIDHDHACCPNPKKTCGQCVRGIICSRCNGALGWYEIYQDRVGEYLQQRLTLAPPSARIGMST